MGRLSDSGREALRGAARHPVLQGWEAAALRHQETLLSRPYQEGKSIS